MTKPQYLTLSKRTIDRLSVDGNDAVFWDCDLQGFGVRVYPSGAKAYVVQSRAFGRSKRVTVGRTVICPPTKPARKPRASLRASKRASLRLQPSLPPTLRWWPWPSPISESTSPCTARPPDCVPLWAHASKHIVPALGELLVGEVERKHIMAFQYGLRDTPTVANRGVDILGLVSPSAGSIRTQSHERDGPPSLTTLRSQVQILPPQPSNPLKALMFSGGSFYLSWTCTQLSTHSQHGGGFVRFDGRFVAALTAKGRRSPIARKCLSFFRQWAQQ